MTSKNTSLHWERMLLVLLAVVAVGGFALYFEKPTVEIKPVPSFTLHRFDDTTMRFEKFRGKPVMMNFWASWCVPCRSEMPAIEKLFREYEDKGLIVFGVHRTELEDQMVAEEVAKSLGITYILLADPKNRLYDYFGGGITAIPVTVFIDRDGFLKAKVIGPRKEEEFRDLIKSIL